jgi:ABC-type lipoprotein export system ATPase subunit
VSIVLTAVDVNKNFGEPPNEVRAVRGVSLKIEAGRFIAICGPSGSGKSTLMHVLAGIEDPTSGTVLWQDTDLFALNDDQRSKLRRKMTGFIFQKFNLLPTLSAAENVALPLLLDGVAMAAAVSRAREALERVGLGERDKHLPSQLSGGEQQRVAIARALINNPKIIFADEPTGALDTANTQRILELLHEIADAGQTILGVTHDPVVAASAHRRLDFRDGKLVSDAAVLAAEVS